MTKVDISSEAVERLAQESERLREAYGHGFSAGHFASSAATLRAQAERIKELEAQKSNLAKVAEGYREKLNAMCKDAAMDALVAEGQRCDAMTPQEAAKVLLDWSGDYMPDKAKLPAVRAYLNKAGKVQPVALNRAWFAALRAISEDSQ